MKWSTYNNDEQLKSEVSLINPLWDEINKDWVIDYSEPTQSEIISEKESSTLTKVYFEIIKLIHKRQNLITYKYVKEASFELFNKEYFTDSQAKFCVNQLMNFYSLCKKIIGQKESWLGFALFFDVISGTHERGNFLIDEFSDTRFNKLIKKETKSFVDSIRKILLMERIFCRENNEIASNLILFSNERLINRYKEKSDVHLSEKIDFLFKIRYQLLKSPMINIVLIDNEAKLKVTPRETTILMNWIDKTLNELCPSIFCLKLRNSDQKKRLQVLFENLVEGDKLIINHNFDDRSIKLLLDSRFCITGNRGPNVPPSSFDFYFSVGSNGRASEIISELYKSIRGLNSGNSPTEVKRWLHNLFCNSRDGFSYSNIKKYCEAFDYSF